MCAYIWIGDIIYPWSFFTASLRDKLSWLCQQPCIWSPLIATIMVRHSTWLSYLKYIWIRHIKKYPTMHYFGIPKHIQSMRAYTMCYDFDWEILGSLVENCFMRMLLTCLIGFMDCFHADQSSTCYYQCSGVVCGMSHMSHVLCVAAYNVASKNVQTTIDFSPRSLWKDSLHMVWNIMSPIQLQGKCQSISFFYIDISLKVLLAPSVFLGVCNALVYAVGEWLITWI